MGVDEVGSRTRKTAEALGQIISDEEILGGLPVFRGTRVPIETVLASLDAGVDMSVLKESYPFLTAELVDAARTYAQVQPTRARMQRLAETYPGLKLRSSTVVAPAGTGE